MNVVKDHIEERGCMFLNSKNVYFLIGTLSSGGAERVVSNLTLSLPNRFKSKIVLFSNFEIDYSYKGDLIVLDERKPKSVFQKLKYFLLRIQEINKLKNEKGIFISFLEYPNLLNLITGKRNTAIISVRNHMSTKHSKGLKAIFWKWTIKYLYPRANLIVAVTNEIKNDLIVNFGLPTDLIKVINNPYDLDQIDKLSREPLEEKYNDIFDKPTLISVGRLENQKGYFHLIRIFKSLKENNPDAQLVILGEGRLKQQLINLSKNFGISDSVHFLGFKKNPFKYIKRADAFVFTSLYEGFPNALSEAMACGIPVISTDCLSGPREILAPDEPLDKIIDYNIDKNRFGILSPVFSKVDDHYNDELNTEELVYLNKLQLLLDNREISTHFSMQSLNRIKDFDSTIIMKQWEGVFDGL